MLVRQMPQTPIGLDNQDPLPWVFPENISMFDYLFPPYIVSPVAHEVLQGKITVIWEPAFDIQGHPVTYTALYSPNLGITWILIATDIESTSLTWDASSLPSGSNYQLKIVATCSGGKTAFTVSSEPFYIKKVITTLTTTFETTSQSKTPIPAISFSFFLLHAIFLVILKRRLDRKEK